MKIKPKELQNYLHDSLSPIYIISGDEPFQKDEINLAIKQKAQSKEFEEKLIFHVDSDFDWQKFKETITTMSLFSTRRIIDLKILSEKSITQEGTETLKFYANNPSSTTILILTFEKINKNIENRNWFKSLEKKGIWIPVWNIEGRFFEKWIKEHTYKHGFKITPEAVALLSEKTDGNLLAADQEIKKLKLLVNSETITFRHVNELIANSAHYNVFNLAEAIISGKKKKYNNHTPETLCRRSRVKCNSLDVYS